MSNTFTCVGTLSADAEYKEVGNSSTPLLTFRIANNNYDIGKKENVALWVRCQIWGAKAGGSLKDYLKKGQQVYVSGQLTINEYEAKDGTIKTSLELNCNVCDLVGKKSDNTATPQQTTPIAGKVVYDYDDTIPF